MELLTPSERYKDSFIGAVKEFQAKAETNDRSKRYVELSVQELEKDFDTYVQREKGRSLGQDLPTGYVPETTYWLVDGDEFIGRVSIRHQLTEHLREIGGHIGYDIRPSKRRQGYGNKILELALPKAKELGIQKALLTCDETNVSSRKIIEKNGGILENKVNNPETGIDKLRFWITIG
jgi:predicted acetyltransferase